MRSDRRIVKNRAEQPVHITIQITAETGDARPKPPPCVRGMERIKRDTATITSVKLTSRSLSLTAAIVSYP